jgi:hypothetical protein
MPSAFPTVPRQRWACSPAARWDQGTQTSERGDRLDSLGFDWCRWLGRGTTRCWPAAKQPRRLRSGEVPGGMWGGAKPYVTVEALVGVRERSQAWSGRRARGRVGSPQRRLWRRRRTACSLTCARKGVFIGQERRKIASPELRDPQWRRHGTEAVGDVLRADGQWRKAVRAGASARRLCGTGLGVGKESRPVGT